MKEVFILAIESSCDETSCAIVKNGKEVIEVNFISGDQNRNIKYTLKK